MTQQDEPESKSVRMDAALPRSCGFLRWTEHGALEIELYDHGDSAHDGFGNDVATIYTVASENYERLLALSPKAVAAGNVLRDDAAASGKYAQLQRLADAYSNVDELIATLRNSGIEFSCHFDSWA